MSCGTSWEECSPLFMKWTSLRSSLPRLLKSWWSWDVFHILRIWKISCVLCFIPDLTCAMLLAWLASFFPNLVPDHCTAVKNVLMYFRITRNYILVFSSGDLKMPEYNDSDFQADRDSRISTSGSLFSLNGWSVTWRSVRQSCIADSTMLADYVAICEAAWRLYSFQSSL